MQNTMPPRKILAFSSLNKKRTSFLQKVTFTIIESKKIQSIESRCAWLEESLHFAVALRATREIFSLKIFSNCFLEVIPKLLEIAWFSLEYLFLQCTPECFNYVEIRTLQSCKSKTSLFARSLFSACDVWQRASSCWKIYSKDFLHLHRRALLSEYSYAI